MATTILRFEKHKSFAGINKAGAHQHRHMDTPNADKSRENLNVILKGNSNLPKTVKTIFEKNGIKPRKNAVLAMDGMLTLSPEAFKTQGDVELFKRQANKFLESKFGSKYISGVYHGDESSPHVQFTVIPVQKKNGKWKLNARDMFNKSALSQLQKDFYAHMQQHFPELEPPKHGSKRKHTEIAHFYHVLDDLQANIKLEAERAVKQLRIDCKSIIIERLKPLLEKVESELGDKIRAEIENDINNSIDSNAAINSFANKISAIANKNVLSIKNDEHGSLSVSNIAKTTPRPKM